MSPCESCHAGCCRSFAVPVSGADILRLEDQLGLTFWDFACRWADPEGLIARNHAPQFYFDDDPETPYVICLTHEPSKFLQGTTKCRFLMEGEPDADSPLGQARCGVYNARPGACRAFPAKLNNTGELAILYDVPPNGRPSDPQPAYDLCAKPWSVEDLDPVSTVGDLVVARYEMGFFRQLATIWNRDPRPWSVFPDFVRLVYANRIVREQVAEDDQPSTIPFAAPVAPPESRREAA